MEAHYINSGYPYASTDNYMSFFGEVTHAPVNYVYSGQVHNQENVYWPMHMNPYRYGYSDPGSNSYYGYEVNNHLPSSEVNQRAWEYPSLIHVEEPHVEEPHVEELSNIDMPYEENADGSSEDSSEECMSNHDANNSEAAEDWPDNIDPDNMTYEELLDLGEAVGTESRGLSQELIKSLPTSWYKSSGFFSRKKSKERCVICLVTYKIGDQQITLPCKHVYHKKCGSKWLSINKTCPVCNQEVFGSEAQQRQQ